MSEALNAAEDAAIDPVVEDNGSDIEAEALEMGWRPLDQFKGDKSNFIDAAEFVRRGKEFVPFLKANNAKLEKEVQGLKKTLKQFGEFHTKVEQRAYERALKDLEQRQAEAVEANDLAEVRAVTKEIADLTAEVKAGAKEAPQDDAEAFDEWKEANPWFEKDKVLRGAAIAIADEIKGDYPDPIKQRAEIAKRIKAEFPEKFTNPRRQQAAAVEGAERGPRTSGKTYADLPADAKAFCDELVRNKVITKEQYVKDFFR